MMLIAFILSTISSMIIGFAVGGYCGYHSANEEFEKIKKEKKHG